MSKRKRPRQELNGKEASADEASAERTVLRSFSFRGMLAAIVCVALILRLLHVFLTVEVPTVVFLIGDSVGYFDWATRIAEGQWYGSETFYQAPLYPYFLAVLIKTLGAGVLGIRLVQALLGVISVLMVGLTARNLFSGPVGLVAAAMLAVYPPAIYYDGIIQKAALASVLLCSFLAACSWFSRRPTGWVSVAMGLLLGLLVLTRENAILWLPIVPFWLLVANRGLPIRRRGVLVACYLLGASLVLLPVAARNASLGGEWSPTTFQAGPNFYIGNNLLSDGIYRPLVAGHETPMYERADAVRLAEAAEGRELTAREVSQFWMTRSLAEIRQSPARWLQLMVQKSFMVVNRFEVPDVESMYIYRQYSTVLKLAPVWHFGVLCPLAVVGICFSWSRWRQLWLNYALTLSMIAAIVLFFVLGRYRFPLVPLLIPLAASGAVQLWELLRSKQWSVCRGPLVMGTLAAVLCNLPVHDEQGLNATSIMNVGISAGQNGDLQTCLRLLRQAVELQPYLAEPHYNLAHAWTVAGKPLKAIDSYRNALLMNPQLPAADFQLAQSLEQVGQVEAALFHYQRAARIDPRHRATFEAIERLSRSESVSPSQ